MHLLVGIDTEGDNQWDAAARANQTFENIYALPRLHALFARHGVRPTYVITYPVATDARSAEVLRALQDGGDCEIGAHHHAWETPPCTAEDVRRHPYASTLPRRQFEAQLDVADRRDRARRRAAPRLVSLRPVRFLRRRTSPALERLGYRVESSVAPLFYEAHKGGPGFRRGAALAVLPRLRQRRRGRDERRARGPGLGGAEPPPAAAGCSMPTRARRAVHDQARAAGAAALLRMRWLRPSYSSLEDMVGARPRPRRRDEPVLNLLFHSSEAIVGGSPYNRTRRGARRFLRSARAVLRLSPRASCAPRRSRSRSSRYDRRSPSGRLTARLNAASSMSRRICRRTRRPTRCCRGSSATGRRRGDDRRVRRAPAAVAPADARPRSPRDGRRGSRGVRAIRSSADAAPGSLAGACAHPARGRRPDRGADLVHVHSNGLLPELGGPAGAAAPASRSC